jgi:uncharacterized membrane protein YagU involved in acid resistance
MQQNHPYPIAAADGALVGLLAGLIGGVLGTLLAIPIEMMMGPIQKQLMERILSHNQEIPEETRRFLENMNVGAAAIVFKLVFSVFIGAVFGMLGGLLGVALFKKKDLPPAPGSIEILPPA